MSSCFFSSREKMRISPMSVARKCFKTVWPNEPVPPVIMSVALVNADIILHLFLICFARKLQPFSNSIIPFIRLKGNRSSAWCKCDF